MSAPGRHSEYFGTANAANGAAASDATGQMRSYGVRDGEGGVYAGSPQHPQQSYGYEVHGASGAVGHEASGMPGSIGWEAPYGYNQYGQPYQGYPQGYAPGPYQMPITSQPVQVKRKSRKGVIIAILVALVAIVLAILLALSMCTEEKSRRQGDAGQLEGKSDAEIQAELDRVVEEGMFNISIASVVEMENGRAVGDLRIENVPGNRYLMQVTLVRNDTGEQIYQTDLIEPNHHIQRDTLDVVLPKGSYECTALFEALDPETEELVGQAAAVITLNVLS